MNKNIEYLRPDEKRIKSTFKTTNREAKAYCRTKAWTIPPKTCLRCNKLIPSGNHKYCIECSD